MNALAIDPARLFRLVDEGDGDRVMEILEAQPESLAACVLAVYLLARGFIEHSGDDDAMEDISDWAIDALEPHGPFRQVWACDEVHRHLLATGQAPFGWEQVWGPVRQQSVSELTI